LLLDTDWRKRVVVGLADRHLQTFWSKEYGAYSASFRNEAIAPILNKVGQFLASPFMRAIVGQSDNTFAMRHAMDEGKIVLVNLAKGQIGEDASTLRRHAWRPLCGSAQPAGHPRGRAARFLPHRR
jgi:hypothetical protein